MSAAFLPGTAIEMVRERAGRGRLAHALFDFDGTISLLRQGWQEVMIPLMVEVLAATPRGRDEPGLAAAVDGYIAESTGLQTIYQMIWLADQVAARGGARRDPEAYKAEYLRRLAERLRARLAELESGRAAPERFLVPGAAEFLARLVARGVKLHCASGTDQPDVQREAGLLGVAGLFEGRVWGARSDYRAWSKKLVVESIIAEGKLGGPELAVAGDGFVEIEEARAAGALAVAVATDEPALLEFRSGRRAAPPGPDAWKRQRLIRAGADLVVPDFRDGPELARWLGA
jgi:phosphoglycolate phosphatase-like HAD superfamily hydrolase